MLQETLRDEHATVVLVLGSGTLGDGVSNAAHDVLQGFLCVVRLFRDNDHVGASLESALESKVGRILTHKSNEVPVLYSGGTVGKHVADQLRVNL